MQHLEDYIGKPLITREERCAVGLSLMERFDAFARANGLTYWLFWGTMLGAVRHKGLIPWDDDIDIAMPQSDYLRLIDLMREEPGAIEDAYLNAFELNRGYTRPFAKLNDARTVLFEDFDICHVEEGVYIDIFPLVPLSDDAGAREAMRRRWRKDFVLSGLSKGRFVVAKSVVKNIGKALLRPYAKLRGYEPYIADLCSDVDAVRFEFGETRYVGCMEEAVSQLEASWFAGTELMQFEHMELPVPQGWDEALRTLYGDYLQLPPEKDRVCHQSTAYWKA